MKEILKESLIITLYMFCVSLMGMGLYYLVGLIAETGFIILTLLATVVAMFIFVFSIIAMLRFIKWFITK